MDHHVQAAVTEGLRRREIDVAIARDDGYAEREDAELLARATELGRIVFTQDDDFLVIARQWQTTGNPFAGVVYGHQLDVTVGSAVRDLELICHVMTNDEIQNQIIYLPF
jgi:hypothetical protein